MDETVQEDNLQKRLYKIDNFGGDGVGKSSLTFRIVEDQFVEKYDPTIEDSYRKDKFDVDGEKVSMEISDTAMVVISL